MDAQGNDPDKRTVDAVYQDGVIRPLEALDLPESAHIRITVEPVLRVTIESVQESKTPGRNITVPWPGWLSEDWISAIRERLRAPAWMVGVLPQAVSLNTVLFALALLVYAATHLIRLGDFPIYFFSDEAIHAVLANDLIHNGFRGPEGALLPTYFKNYQVWNLSLSVYIHALTVALFGKSIFVTRATSAVVSLLGVAAVGLILKYIFENRFWWAGVLIMTVTPAWFLHSRTAFETVMMVSFYAVFLLLYLLYRCRSPRYLFPAVVFGAATFYAYANGQAVMAVTAVLFFVSDFRYHLRNWRTVLAGLGLAVLLAVPYLRFRADHPTEISHHLRILGSYWLKDIPATEKLVHFVKTYLAGLNPKYWFFPNDKDLVRHRWGGHFGHLMPETLPLFLLGLAVCLRHARSSPHRAVILAGLATPFGAATVDIGITRVLAFVVPATILITLGLAELLDELTSRVSFKVVALGCFALLAVTSFWMLRSALVHGPAWYRNYGLYGMQYGVKQLFEIIPEYLERNSQTQVMLSPTWANGTDIFPRFFLDGEPRLKTLNVDAFMDRKRPLNHNMVFIMTALEYQKAKESDKFKSIEVERVLPYPDGTPGFYFARLAYADNVDAIFAREQASRRQPVEARVEIAGQQVQVRHPPLDMGRVVDMFDGDWYTLGRVMEANPALIELTFPQPRSVAGVAGDFGSMEFAWTIEVYAPGTEEPVVYTETYRKTPPDPHAEVTFERGPEQVSKIRIEIRDLRAGGSAKIHIRELTLK